MGRPPHGGGPVFRFTSNEVMEMEARLQEMNSAVPDREIISVLADKFSASVERAGKTVVQSKQVWNWFQNRRYAQRAKLGKAPGKLSVSSMPRREPVNLRNEYPPVSTPPGKTVDNGLVEMEFEAKSTRDGAWYDVSDFLAHRISETGDPEVWVRFSGFGVEEDEWVNVRKFVRQRSLPCEIGECGAVLPGDLILCFQEGKEQALYFDARVLDAQRRRHDMRGCRCRFLVRYDHDQSEEIVALRKVCRRPETDYRLPIAHATSASESADQCAAPTDGSTISVNLAGQRVRKQHKLMDVNTDEITTVAHLEELVSMQGTSTTVLAVENSNSATTDIAMDDGAGNTEGIQVAEDDGNTTSS